MAFWVDDTQWKEPTQKGIVRADLCVLQKKVNLSVVFKIGKVAQGLLLGA